MISECRNRIKKNAQDAKTECFLCIFCFFLLCNVASQRRALAVLALLRYFLREMDAVKNGIAVLVYKIFLRFHAKIFCSTQ